jgi:hypothetical protein
MARALSFAFFLCLAGAAGAQRNQLWSNPALAGRAVAPAEQQMILRQDMSHCHGAAFEGTRNVPEEEKRKALGTALFKRCMAEKGWTSRDPAAPKPAPKAPRPTST